MSDKREIVAVLIDGKTVTNIPKVIIAAIDAGQDVRYLDRAHMRLMAAADLGERWCRLADGPTLFCIVDGEPVSAQLVQEVLP